MGGAIPRRRQPPLDRYQEAIGRRLGVYYIAEQSYCEYRVDLWLRDPGARLQIPRVAEDPAAPPPAAETIDRADAGIDGHASLADATDGNTVETLDELLRHTRPTAATELTLLGSWGGVDLIGRPDLLIGSHGSVNTAVDFKITPSRQRQRSYVTQLQIYGYLLEESGANCDALLLCAALIHPRYLEHLELGEFDASQLSDRVHHAWQRRRREQKSASAFDVPLINDVTCSLRVFPYDRSIATTRELRFFLDYWRGARDPIPTESPKKCANCQYAKHNVCDSSLSAYA